MQRFTVSASEKGCRLDRWLVAKLGSPSRRQVKSLIDKGQVQINGRRVVIAGWKLEPRDEVVVGPRPAKAGAFGGRLKIYHQDRDLIVVEKPAGLPAVPKRKGEDTDSLLDRVRSYLKRKYAASKGTFVFPLHRLDAGTSGAMVFALSKVGQKLSAQFRDHSIRREYVAIIAGRMKKEQGVIDRPLEKGRFKGGRKVRQIRGEGGQAAVTEYRVKERYPHATLLQVRLKTGRTHQIRVHLAGEGFPLIGERTYSQGVEAKTRLPFYRHALHASLLGFCHPATGVKLLFRSPLPPDLQALIEDLQEGKGKS